MKNVPIRIIFVDAYFQVIDKFTRSCKNIQMLSYSLKLIKCLMV